MRFPSYEGHFPDDPIVPGAALLVAIGEELARQGERRRVGRLERVRFLGVVRPGEEVELRVAVDGDRVRFGASRGGVEVLRGVGTLAPSPAEVTGPVRLAPTLMRPLWGGTTLAGELGKDRDPTAQIGESWEVWRDNRAADGRPLSAITDFPLLIKLLDVRERLSVQVHPDNAAAIRLVGAPHGKHEGWVVLRAEPGAKVAYGLQRTLTREELHERALSGEIEADLAWLPVAAGDVIDVPPGTIHAIGGGVLFYEVQQPCDLTWRLYDWGRGRTLHLESALEVAIRRPVTSCAQVRTIGPGQEVLLESAHFHVERLTLPQTRACRVWEAFTVVAGAMTVGDERVPLGATVLLPPGEWSLEGEGTVLAARA